MVDQSRHTRVCSVLFIDIVGYSKKTVAEQLELKQACNDMLAGALGETVGHDCVLLDTGDGAALTFLGAPENALFVALRTRDGAGDLSLRMGVNLGPVRLVIDLNGQENVVGDGINVAQRVMGFCEPGELLVSRSFYEVACRLAPDYVNLFVPRGAHLDKHSRSHEVYAIVPDARKLLRSAETEWLQRATSPGQPATAASAAKKSGGPARVAPASVSKEAARIFDAGSNLIISGYTRESVEKALASLGGVRLISPASQVGDRWVATCEHPEIAVSACKVEVMGYTHIVTGPTREAVSAKVEELTERGAVIVTDVESAGGIWTAVCEIKDHH